MAEEAFRRRTQRPAVVLDIGGFRPPADPLASWFGRVSALGRGEPWPTHAGVPLAPLAQVNLADFPFRPPGTEDVAFLSLWIDAAAPPPAGLPNGRRWCLRAYATLAELEPVAAAAPSVARPFPMRPRLVEADHPCWEDAGDVPPELEDGFSDRFPNAPGFKFGGWPSLVQSEIQWAAPEPHPAAPGFVFQIDSAPKAGWSWGDGGVGYVGRGTAPGQRGTWVLEWQGL